MVFDVNFYATEELATKSYASYYVQFEAIKYLEYNYPKVNYECITTNYVGLGEEDDGCDDE